MGDNHDASSQVLACISSPSNFNNTHHRVLESISLNSKSYNDSFLKTITDVLTSSDYSPISKFYALYLLGKASETDNEFFAVRILKTKPLLDKLFTDCQYDGSKPMNDRGKKFFSKTPNIEESILGGNYILLLLEIFAYWNITYGRDNSEDPLHAYQIMYNTLAEKIKFPSTFLYLKRTYEITDDFHLMPPASLPRLDTSQRSVSPTRSSQPNSPEIKRPTVQSPTTTAQIDQTASQKKPTVSTGNGNSNPTTSTFFANPVSNPEPTSSQKKPVPTTSSQSNPTTSKFSADPVAVSSVGTSSSKTIASANPILAIAKASASGDTAGDDIRACLPSGRNYKNNSQRVFENIMKNPKEYSTSYIKVTNEILKSKEETPVRKFYLVYLLLKATENTYSLELVTELASHQELMNELFVQAQTDRQKEEKEKGKKIFSKTPSSEEAKIGHNFLTVILESFIFWRENFVPSGAKTPTHIFNKVLSILEKKTTLPSNLYYAGKVHDTDGDHLPTRFELIAPEDLYKISAPSSQKIENPKKTVNEPQQQTPGAGSSDGSLGKLKEGLRKLQEDKNSLREFLENNQDEGDLGQLLQILVADVSNTYQKNVTDHVEEVLTNPTPSSEKYVTQVFTEGETIDQINSAYSNYTKKKSSYKDFKARVLPLLKSNEDTGSKVNTPGISETVNNFKTSQKEAVQTKTEEINREVNREVNQAREQVRSRATPILDSFEAEQKISAGDYQKQIKDIAQGSTAYKQTEEFVERGPAVVNEKRQMIVNTTAPIENAKEKFLKSPQQTGTSIYASNPLQSSYEQQKKASPSPSPHRELEESKGSPDQFHEKPRRVNSKKDIQDDIYKFKASETIEDDNNEPRENQSIQQLSPIKRVEDNESIEHEKSSKPFNSRVDEDQNINNNNRSMKLSTMKSSSFKMTPSRHTETEGEDWSRSMKLSRIKPQDLSMIESSIRQSFINTGKKPPQFRPLNELQVKEEYEKEISKLKTEKEALHKEVSRLNSVISEGPKSGDLSQSRVADDHLRQILEQQQQRIEALQEENAMLSQVNNKLKKKSEAWEGFKPGNVTEQESLQYLNEKLSLEERVRELEGELNMLRSGKKQPVSSQNTGSRIIGRTGSGGSGYENGQVRRSMEYPPRGSVTNPGDESMQTPYNADWANTNQTASYENSMYDVEWPASAYKEKMRVNESGDLRKQVENKKEEIAKTIKGRLVEGSSPVYSQLKAKVAGQSPVNDLRKFKVACLKAKAPLFESEHIQVGVSSNVVHDEKNNLNMLKLVLYFENKGTQYIDLFSTDVIDGKGLNKIAKPAKLETGIERGKQVKQQIVLAFEKIPFENLQLVMDVRTNGIRENLTLSLPTLITKFMQFKYVTVEDYKEKWRGKSAAVQKTEEITIDTGIVKTAYDFKKYFNYLIDLKPMDEYDFVQGKKSIKLGGVFDLDIPDAEHLLKINVLPTHQVVFQIATTEKESYVASFILQALTFLFRK